VKKIGILMGVMLMCNTSFAVNFSDVSGHWAEKYITQATQREYFSGYPDGTFLPGNSITRMEFIIICSKFMNKNVELKNVNVDNAYVYPDVHGISWALPLYKEFMTKVNIYGSVSDNNYGYEEMKGIFGEYFRPNDPITREEAVAIFNLFIDDNYKNGVKASFSDMDVATFPKSISTAANLKIVSGYTDGTFKPRGLITRAEAAAMLLNFENVNHIIPKINYVDEQNIVGVYNSYMEPDEVVATILNYEKNNEYYNSYQLHDSEWATKLGYTSYVQYAKDEILHTYNKSMDLTKMKYKTIKISDIKVEVEFTDGKNTETKILEKKNGKWYANFGLEKVEL